MKKTKASKNFPTPRKWLAFQSPFLKTFHSPTFITSFHLVSWNGVVNKPEADIYNSLIKQRKTQKVLLKAISTDLLKEQDCKSNSLKVN